MMLSCLKLQSKRLPLYYTIIAAMVTAQSVYESLHSFPETLVGLVYQTDTLEFSSEPHLELDLQEYQ